MERRRVAVTGTGMITSVGLTRDDTWSAVKAGRIGISSITAFDASEFKVRFAGEIKEFDPAVAMDPKDARKADRYAQFAICAAEEALAQAQPGDVDPLRAGVIIASGIGGMITFEEQHTRLMELGATRVSPMFIPMMRCWYSLERIPVILIIWELRFQ